MDYVVLDLEWNQASDSRDARNRLLTFEIIEIGAVKLNSRMEIVDTFEELIRPQVYDTMHHITEKLIGIHMKDLSGCRTFDVVMKDFLAWCGEDFMFGTWGPQDLTELQKNMRFFGMEPLEKDLSGSMIFRSCFPSPTKIRRCAGVWNMRWIICRFQRIFRFTGRSATRCIPHGYFR